MSDHVLTVDGPIPVESCCQRVTECAGTQYFVTQL